MLFDFVINFYLRPDVVRLSIPESEMLITVPTTFQVGMVVSLAVGFEDLLH